MSSKNRRSSHVELSKKHRVDKPKNNGTKSRKKSNLESKTTFHHQTSKLDTNRNFRKSDGSLITEEDVKLFQLQEKEFAVARMAALRENLNKLVDFVEARINRQIEEGVVSLMREFDEKVEALSDNAKHNAVSAEWTSTCPGDVWATVWDLGFTKCGLTLKSLINFSLTCKMFYGSKVVWDNWWCHVEKKLLKTNTDNPGRCMFLGEGKHTLTYTNKKGLKDLLCDRKLYFCFKCKCAVFCPLCRKDAYRVGYPSEELFADVKHKRHKNSCPAWQKVRLVDRSVPCRFAQREADQYAFMRDPWVACGHPDCDVIHECGAPIYMMQKKKCDNKTKRTVFETREEENSILPASKRRRTAKNSPTKNSPLVAVWPPVRKLSSNKIEYDAQRVDDLTSLARIFEPETNPRNSNNSLRYFEKPHAFKELKDVETTFELTCRGFPNISHSLRWFK